MRLRRRQGGTALLIGVFLIVVIALVGTMIALTSTTQQVASARNLQATQAYYAARARLERALAVVVNTTGNANACPTDGPPSDTPDFAGTGFTIRLVDCDSVDVDEGGDTYEVYSLEVAAFTGSRSSGTLVRRDLEAVVTNKD